MILNKLKHTKKRNYAITVAITDQKVDLKKLNKQIAEINFLSLFIEENYLTLEIKS